MHSRDTEEKVYEFDVHRRENAKRDYSPVVEDRRTLPTLTAPTKI